MKRLLLINPWIHDFAAYDFWARPAGLLQLGAILRRAGFLVDFFDFVDPNSPHLPEHLRPPRRVFATGKFFRAPLKRPEILPYIGRRWSRYGLPTDDARRALAAYPRPAAILVTSMMTYWYRGVFETIELLREVWPETPIILGGVYATLCTLHARENSGADLVAPGPAHAALPVLLDFLGFAPTSSLANEATTPLAYDLAPKADSAPLLCSLGCPLNCLYCGVKQLQPRYCRFPLSRIEQDLQNIARAGIRDIAIYDDAFLANPQAALEILDHIAALRLNLRLHAASGLSCRFLDEKVARAMVRAGFSTIRLGLETAQADEQVRLGNKASLEEFRAAVAHLLAAGLPRQAIGVYLLVGLPKQTIASIESSLAEVLSLDLQPHLAEYSPVPQSPMFKEACALAAATHPDQPNLEAEPLWHNPTLLPCASPEFTPAVLHELKEKIRIHRQLPTSSP